MKPSKLALPILFLTAALPASAVSMFIQTSAGTGGSFTDTSRIQAAGANDTPVLTLNGPAVQSTFYAATVQPFGGSKPDGVFNTNLFININIVQEDSITTFTNGVNGTFTVTVPLVETVVGGVASFSAPNGVASFHVLTDGRFLEITPLADSNITNGENEQANFRLLSSAPVPEPASLLLAGVGLIALSLIGRRYRRSR